jgi:hypothetical protein
MKVAKLGAVAPARAPPHCGARLGGHAHTITSSPRRRSMPERAKLPTQLLCSRLDG